MTFQLDLNFLTRDLKPLFGVNSSPLDELKMIVLLCCPSAFSPLASCQDDNKIVIVQRICMMHIPGQKVTVILIPSSVDNRYPVL